MKVANDVEIFTYQTAYIHDIFWNSSCSHIFYNRINIQYKDYTLFNKSFPLLLKSFSLLYNLIYKNKTNLIPFGNKGNTINMFERLEIEVRHVDHIKILGVVIDDMLTWNTHVDTLCKTIRRCILNWGNMRQQTEYFYSIIIIMKHKC